MPSRSSPQWLCGNSCTWAHDVRLHIAGTNEPKSAQQAKQGAMRLFSTPAVALKVILIDCVMNATA